MNYSAGIIKNIDDYNNIMYECETSKGSGVGPLINSRNFQVIGVHKGKNLEYKCALGIFLKKPLLKVYEIFGLQKIKILKIYNGL